MIVNADDYRQRAAKLEQLARQTPNECLRKSLYSIAANWRAVACSFRDERPSLRSGPLIDGLPGRRPAAPR